MQKFISHVYLKLSGWKIEGSIPSDLKKAVIIAAPHTSMWDFIIGRAGLYSRGVKHVHFLIKKEMFKFPIGPVIKSLGAMPIDRGKNNQTIAIVKKMFDENENLLLLITPEGTRKYTEKWKKGFYHIAIEANVPIIMTFVDYKKKEGGIGPILYPTGNFEEDFKVITAFYKDKTAKYPEQFNLTQFKKNNPNL